MTNQARRFNPNAILDGTPPTIPQGVLAAARSNTIQKGGGPIGEDRVTWQPNPGVRQAIVAVSASNGYVVVAGRNMREVENRQVNLEEMIFAGMVMLLVVTLIAKIIADGILKK